MYGPSPYCKQQVNIFFLEVVNNLLGIGINLPADVGLLTIMRILFPMPPEQQSVIKRATESGGILNANLGNVEGQIKQGNFSVYYVILSIHIVIFCL